MGGPRCVDRGPFHKSKKKNYEYYAYTFLLFQCAESENGCEPKV